MTGIRLTAQEARDLMCIKKECFTKTLSIIRQMCDISLRDTSRRGSSSMQFDVPQTVWGRDSYDHHSMGKALAKQLFDDGFDVTGTTTKLLISWGSQGEETVALSNSKPIYGLTFKPQNARMTPVSFVDMLRGEQLTNQKKKKVERKVSIPIF